MAATTTTTEYRTRKSPISLSIAAFVVLIATIFFWLSAFSVPYIKGIYYIKTRADGTKFGNFGWCSLGDAVCYHHVGYAWHPEILDNTHLTGSLILVALTAAFGTLAFFFLLHSIADLRSGVCSFFLTIVSAFLSTLSFLLVVICFGVAHHRFSEEDLNPHYGAALPLIIIGWLLYLVAIPFVVIGWFRERHYRHQMTTTTTTGKRKWW